VFLFLDGSPELIRQRMLERQGHYMQADLLDSQLQTLENPTPQETDVIRLTIHQSIAEILQHALEQLQTMRPNDALQPALSLQSN